MVKENNKQIPDISGGQNIDRSLLEYLRPKSEDRYSKLEAFCDLLSRASSSTLIATSGDHSEELVPGQFVTSFSELSRKWKWQRVTVRQFIEGLVSLGQLTVKPFAKSFIFTLSIQQRLSINVESYHDILDFCNMQFTRCLYERCTADEVADSYDRYFKMLLDSAHQLSEEESPENTVLSYQENVFNDLALSVCRRFRNSLPVPGNVSDALSLLFGRGSIWNWHKVVSTLNLLALAFGQGIKPSDYRSSATSYTSAELILLDGLFEHYLSFDRATSEAFPPKPSEVAQDGEEQADPASATSLSTESEETSANAETAHSVRETLR